MPHQRPPPTPPPAIDDTWGLGEPEPTSLIVPWPAPEAPAPQAMAARLSAGLDGSVVVAERLPPADPSMPWCAVLVCDRRDAPLIAWVEPARPLTGDEPPAVTGARAAWVIGIETLLDASDAVGDFTRIVGGLAAAFPEAPAVLDVNTTRWFARDDLDRLFSGGDGGAPAEVMWLTQVVRGAADATWIHTHGLWRCGRPELEMLEVPADAAAGAADMLGGVASIILEHGAPAPGQPLEIGSDLVVVLQPWADVARYLANDTPGASAGRAGDAEAAHAGPRAVICASEPAGSYRQLWVWPEDAVARLRRGEAAMTLTDRATRRQTRLAQAAWDHVVAAFAASGGGDSGGDSGGESGGGGAGFAVKAGLATADERREHLWFEVERADADGLDGRLLNEPRFVQGLAPGASVRLGRGAISDWRVMTRDRSFGPLDARALERHFDYRRSG